MAQLAPLLDWMMSCRICGSTPAFTPSSMPSLAAIVLQKASMLLTTLATQPLPLSPTRKTLAPMCRSSGRTVSKAPASPPTMTAREACSAPTTPPLTGASSIVTPFSASAAHRRCATLGELVLRST